MAFSTPVAPPVTPSPRQSWLDIAKGVAIFVVLLHHFVEQPLGFRALLSDRGFWDSTTHLWSVAQEATRSSFDAGWVVLAALGYQGVHLFLVLSGFGLALADGRRATPLSFGTFLRRRALRLLPPYWIVILALAVLGLLQSYGMARHTALVGSARSDVLINLLLLRPFKEVWAWIYPGTWWFVPLIVQLYLLYPLLARSMKRSPARTLVICALITLAYRAICVFVLKAKPVEIGAQGLQTPLMFAPARLWEFALGVYLGGAWSTLEGKLRARLAVWVGLGALCYAAGVVLTCWRPGFVLGDPLIGTGLFPLALASGWGLNALRFVRESLTFVGRHSYALFLTHPLLMPTPLVFTPQGNLLLELLIWCIASGMLALLLEGSVFLVERGWTMLVERWQARLSASRQRVTGLVRGLWRRCRLELSRSTR